MRKVISVVPFENKKVEVAFSDGLTGIFDVAPYIRSEFFKKLEDPTYFNQVAIFFTGIGWPDGQDLGPDTIEAELQPIYDEDSISEKKLLSPTRALDRTKR